MNPKRILIVGGVAAGASAATRARRLDEHAEIILFEKGPYVSFANCGLPYHVGGVIPEESSLLLVTPERFQRWFDIDVRVRHEVTAIDRAARRVAVLDHETGRTISEPYDALVLAPGSRAVVPPLPGVDLPGVFLLRTVPDAREVRAWIEQRAARRAVVIGAGPIGVEVAENLRHRSLEVDLVELQDQILPSFDPEMIQPFAAHLSHHGVRLRLGQALEGVQSAADGSLEVALSGGETLSADLLILALGARPETSLARSCGLTLGPGGGIAVDASMQTSDPFIWAAGDAVESACLVAASGCNVALAGIANRQGRVAADAIAGRPAQMRAVLGTHVCGAFGMTVAATGSSEKRLAAEGRSDYQCVWLHPKHHAAYYPGAESIHMKLVFSKHDGALLGAQAVGKHDAEKRIDVIAMAMQLGGSVYDLEQAELCYAPQFGSAKDPVNLAGMIAANQLRGDTQGLSWSHWPDEGAVLVDVREREEFERRHVPGARSFPLSELRDRLSELPRDRDVWVYCQTGKRSYDAARLLLQRGFRAKTLLGGLETYEQFHAAARSAPMPTPPK